MSINLKELEIEDLEEIIDKVNEVNYNDFSSFKRGFKEVLGKVPKDTIDEIIECLYSEFGIESDGDIVDNLNINDFYEFLLGLDVE